MLGVSGTPNTNEASYTLDNISPTVMIKAPDIASASFTATIEFNEEVTGFELDDIQVPSATKRDFNATNARTYTAFTPRPIVAGGFTELNIGADVALDAAGNGNVAAAPLHHKRLDARYIWRR